MAKRKRRAFTKECKTQAVRIVRESGQSVASVARELDLTETTARIERGERRGLAGCRKAANRSPRGMPLSPDKDAGAYLPTRSASVVGAPSGIIAPVDGRPASARRVPAGSYPARVLQQGPLSFLCPRLGASRSRHQRPRSRERGYEFARRGRAKGAERALEEACPARSGTLRPPGATPVIRSDNGLVFQSRRFRAACRDYRLQQKFITPYTPEQNGMIERFFRSLKEECVWQHLFPSFAAAPRVIAAWIRWYNGARTHQALGYWSPRERRVQQGQLVA